METTASQIAGYQGDASAAIGGNAGAALIAGATQADRINDRLDVATLANFQKNKDAYERKLKLRDELFDKLKSKEISTDKFLESDRDQIRQDYIQKMRDMVLEDPDLKSDPQKFAKFQQVADDFEEAKLYGQHRYLMLTGMDADIAKELDPEKRKRMQAHRDAMAKQGLFKEIKPYQQMLDFDDETFAKGKPVTTKDEQLVGDRIVTVTKSRTPAIDFINQVRYNAIDSPNKTLSNKMDVFGDTVKMLPEDQKRDMIDAWNRKIAEVNADEKWTDKDPNYIKPISYTDQANPDGTKTRVITETSARLVLAESLLKNYSKTDSADGKVTDLGAKIRKDDAAAKKDLLEAKLVVPATAAKLMAERAKNLADAAKTKQETQDLKDKASGDGEYHVNQLLSMVDPRNYKGLPRVDEQVYGWHKAKDGQKPQPDIDPKTGKQKQGDMFPADLKNTNIKGYVVMGPDQSGATRTQLSDIQQRALSRWVDVLDDKGVKTGKQMLQKPTSVIYDPESNPQDPRFYAIFDPPKQIKLTPEEEKAQSKLNLYRQATGQGQPAAAEQQQRFIDVVRPQTLATRLIKETIGENPTGNEVNDFKQFNKQWLKRGGGQNINATAIKLASRENYSMETPTQKYIDKKKAAFKD